jgi:hypothetical protein
METRDYLLGLIAAGAVAACGSDRDSAATPAPAAQVGGGQKAQVAQVTAVGTVAFTIEGEEKRFDYLPASGNHYWPNRRHVHERFGTAYRQGTARRNFDERQCARSDPGTVNILGCHNGGLSTALARWIVRTGRENFIELVQRAPQCG